MNPRRGVKLVSDQMSKCMLCIFPNLERRQVYLFIFISFLLFQESYLMAVGEMSPENENSTSALRGRVTASGAASPRIRKQDSYLKAIGNNEDELSPLPRYVSRVVK